MNAAGRRRANQRKLDPPLVPGHANGRSVSQRHCYRGPFGQNGWTFEHDHALLNSPRNFHTAIIGRAGILVKVAVVNGSACREC